MDEKTMDNLIGAKCLFDYAEQMQSTSFSREEDEWVTQWWKENQSKNKQRLLIYIASALSINQFP